MKPSDYLLDRDRREADRRLGLLEEIEDPATVDYLERIGVAEGWRCLEVGGGRGSIASWLCYRAGASGRVVAIDTDPSFLNTLPFGNLEVRQHNVAGDDLEASAFDLVHARNVLVHIPEREAVLRKLARAVRPGGAILLEEKDVSADAADPTAPEPMRRLYADAVAAIYASLVEMGLDPYFGSQLYGRLRSLGFESLNAEGRAYTFAGGSGGRTSPHMLAFGQLRETIVAAGRIRNETFREFLNLADDASFAWREGLMISAWGRRP